MPGRRQFITLGLGAFAGLHSLVGASGTHTRSRKDPMVPLVHITDLYHPPQDPDDHIDLATVVALSEYDLRGVILDVTQKFLDPAPAGFDIARDPGYVPVLQLSHIIGRAIPVAAGPPAPLSSPDDDARSRPRSDQAGIQLLLDILEDSPEPVVLSLVGSTRVVTAAFNRAPELLRSNIRSVLLNAGSTGGKKREWNVGLDAAAYIGLWKSGLPIHWYPCATEKSAFDPDHERGTYWKAPHAALFASLLPAMRSWFSYAFSGENRGDVIRAMAQDVGSEPWEKLLSESRNLWATASLVMAAGRVLARTSAGWRFVGEADIGGVEVWPWRLDPIEATVNEHAEVEWTPAERESRTSLFGRKKGPHFGDAMAEALGALLGTIGEES
jgi:hypothetical protein